MKANTAVCFILCGISLWFLNQKTKSVFKKIITYVFPLTIISIGLLTFIEYLFGSNFGIDEFLYRDVKPFLAIPYPGRMASPTAFCFVLSGIALLLYNKKKTFRIFQIISLIDLCTGLLVLIGHSFQIKYESESWVYLTRMALHTSIGFILLSSGMLFSKPAKGLMGIVSNDGIAGITSRRLLPIIILLPIVLGWVRLHGEEMGLYDTKFGVVIYSFTMIIILSVMVLSVSRKLLAIDRQRKKAE